MKLKVLAISLGIFILIGSQTFTFSNRPFGLNAFAAEPELTLEQILDRLEQHYKNKSFTAEFGQEYNDKAMEITDFATGKMYVRYPGMMRWEYEKPEKRIFITDGKKTWFYIPADNQVQISSAPAFLSDGKGASFLSDIKLLRKKFNISLEQSKNDYFYELKLVPLEKTLDISHILLSITKGTFTIIRIMIYNNFGDENRIELINNKFDVKLDDSLFSFDIPPGADVLKMDE